MKLPIYQVDAFASRLFTGNPAAVVPLFEWLDEKLMQNIALENNLAETAFIVAKGDDHEIRWFTPEVEIDLCGHATLAAAFVLVEKLGWKGQTIRFHSRSGILKVSREGEEWMLDFPSWKPERLDEYPPSLLRSLGQPEILGVYRYRDFLVEFASEDDIKKLRPDFSLMRDAGEKVIATAPGKDVDFVSRFFAPTAGIDEDPVTGSAHAQLIPFWSDKLGKTKMRAQQLSRRGGSLYCEQRGDRVTIGGRCVFYMQGEIFVG